MEIKAILNKPYTEQQRMHFIVEQNHKKGYEIRQTNEQLQAWGYTTEEIAEQERQRKISEIEEKLKTLEQQSVSEILYNNSQNIQVYREVIKSLEETKETLLIAGDN